MPMNPRLLRPTQNQHPEAADWANRVRTNGGSVSGSTLNAVSRFCRAIDAAGIRDRFYRVNLFCGGTSGTTVGLNSALVPLYRGPSLGGTQYGNTIDTNSGGLFVAGDYYETGASGGLTGGGTRHLFTGLTTSALPQIATGHLAAYVMTGIGGATISGILSSWSAGFVGSNAYVLEANRDGAGGVLMSWGNTFPGVTVSAASGAGNGFLATSRTMSTDLRMYKNGSQIGSTSATTVNPVANNGGGFGVFANYAGAAVANYFAGRLGGYSIGAGLSVSQMAAYNTAMQAFQTALSRNV